MLGRNAGIKQKAARKAGSLKDAARTYVDPLTDEKLRQRLVAAIAAGAAAKRRARMQTGLAGIARRLASDPVLRAQLTEMSRQLQLAQKRAKRAHSHKLRNTVLLVGGAGVVVAAIPRIRRRDAAPPSPSQAEPATGT